MSGSRGGRERSRRCSSSVMIVSCARSRLRPRSLLAEIGLSMSAGQLVVLQDAGPGCLDAPGLDRACADHGNPSIIHPNHRGWVATGREATVQDDVDVAAELIADLVGSARG